MAWIRLDTDIFCHDDFCDIPFASRLAVIAILAYVKTYGSKGEVKATHTQIARMYQIPPENIIEALETSWFHVEEKMIQVLNWHRFQIDPTSADRKNKQRQREREGVTVTSVTSGCHASHAYGTGRDGTGQKKSNKKKNPFTKPTLKQIEAHLQEKGITCFTAQEFFNSNEAKGWVVGKFQTPMKNWKSAISTWVANYKKQNPNMFASDDDLPTAEEVDEDFKRLGIM